uniref:KIB1-4 beta-propeller domain-containing protein n=1 Tax=Oryza meridionalis TaxID=40149 RepID=A0A0E0DNE1_9ORYZ
MDTKNWKQSLWNSSQNRGGMGEEDYILSYLALVKRRETLVRVRFCPCPHKSHRLEHGAATTSTHGHAPTQAAIARASAPPLPPQPANERARRCRRRQPTHARAAAFCPMCAAAPKDEEDDSDKDDRKEEAVELGDTTHRPRVEVREANEYPRPVRPPREALRQHAVRAGVRVPRAAYVERSFLVESPPGSPPSTGDCRRLMQVELLRPVAAAEEEGFKVRVLDECGGTWEEADDIGDVAVVVDASGAGAASTRECPRLRRSTMYFAVDPAGETDVCTYSLAAAGSSVPPTSPAVASGHDGRLSPPFSPTSSRPLRAAHCHARVAPPLPSSRPSASSRRAAGARKLSHPYGPQIQGQACLYLVFVSPNP